MHRTRITRITFALLCAMPIQANAQQGLVPKPQRPSGVVPPGDRASPPIHIEADRLDARGENEAEATGNVHLRRDGQAVFADRLRYNANTQEVEATGNVRVEHGRDFVEGDRLRYNLGTHRGFIDTPTFRVTPAPRDPALPPPQPWEPPGLPPVQGRGSADRVLFQGPDLYRAEQASYTTCGPGNDDWFLRARELDIDKNRDIGTARGASLTLLGLPVLYTPYISFSLNNQRTSGVLTPHVGSASNTGFELTVPYYWNIAPNRDATFYPRVMSKRGLQLGAEFRYLDYTYSGDARVEFLPNDSQLDRSRHAYFWRHAQSFGNGWATAVNINRVSDDKYFTDLSSLVSVTSRTILPADVLLAKSAPWGNAGSYAFTAQVSQWQTLQSDPLVPVTPPYDRKPQLAFNAFRQTIWGADFDLVSNYNDFSHPTLVNGRRAVAYPSFSLPLQTSYSFLIPKVGAHVTRYWVDENTQGLREQTRTLPIATADAGLIFERNTTITGIPLIQTLEPRLFYVYIPFRDQSTIPNFESGPLDVTFATMFMENQFSGHDRINDANQVTLGVQSRFIHPDTGIERLRVAVAQRYYFQGQRVTLPGIVPRPDNAASSDLLGAVSGTILPHWTADIGVRYDTDRSDFQQFNVSTRYQPTPGRVLNLAYRDTADRVRQTDISFQWPVTPQWTALARWNYSLQDRRTLEALAGFEYDGGCWAFRAVAHRFATALNSVSTSVFFQLELSGVSRIGTNLTDVLRRNVGGYTRLDPGTRYGE
jgi:LPS-assembly protein